VSRVGGAGLIDASRACLLVIDVQERLVPAIHDAREVLAAIGWLIDLAGELGVPVVATEEYPEGLGATLPVLAARIDPASVLRKRRFSAVAEGGFERLPGADRAQLVVVGMEAHVCVLQTVLDLVASGREVFVVADALGSRKPADRDLALDRMRGRGASIVSREMVAYEWLREGGGERFAELNRRFLRSGPA